jgi:uncharacterized protein YaaN involved in tellurite resistance
MIMTEKFDLLAELKGETSTPVPATTTGTQEATDAQVITFEEEFPVAKLPMLSPQQDLLKWSDLSEEQKRTAEKVPAEVNWKDRNSVRFFGYKEEKAMSDFLDTLLTGIDAKEADLAGELLIALNKNIEELRLQKFQDILAGKGGGIMGLIKSKVDMLRDLIAFLVDRQRDVVKQFQEMEAKVEKEKGLLIEDNIKYDRLTEQTKEYIREIMPIIVGGQIALVQGYDELRGMHAQSHVKTGDTLLASEVRDFWKTLEAFDHRLTSLQIAFTKRAATTIPKIRAIQDAINIELDNLIDKVMFAIPALKEAILDVITTARLQKLQLDRKGEEALLVKIEEMRNRSMKDAVLEAQRSQGDYAAKIACLVALKDTLIQTFEEGKQIIADNKQKRQEAISTLKKVKGEMESAMRDIGIT